jgi:general secretion pathway protein C
MTLWAKRLLPLAISTSAGIVIATSLLIVINASLLRIPVNPVTTPLQNIQSKNADRSIDYTTQSDYKAITDRNLFRAKLQADIPKSKSDKEIEEESLTAILKTMLLKGVMVGIHPKDRYAIIDRGGPKGVWTYEAGDMIEKGLTLKEIRKDSIKVEKGDFSAVLKLFSPVAERVPGSQVVNTLGSSQAAQRKQETVKSELTKEIKREGSVTLISKSLAEKLKVNNSTVMSSLAVKVTNNGLKVVTVDHGSIAQQMGIIRDDTLQEVNGHRLNSSQDMNKVYEALKGSTSFDVKILRKGKLETLRYEIR